jgi:hypothetical protein
MVSFVGVSITASPSEFLARRGDIGIGSVRCQNRLPVVFDADPMPETDNKPEAFLIEEYKNIAATHDKLRDLLVRLFNYFLLLSAFPFTVAGIVFRNGGFNLFDIPGEIRVLFGFVAIGNLCLAVAMVDVRLSQYRYARTVNAIRRYFKDSVPGISEYLYLPTSSDLPSSTSLGFVWPQLAFMVLTGMFFVACGTYGIHSKCLMLAALAAYLGLYAGLHVWTVRRFQKHKGGIK